MKKARRVKIQPIQAIDNYTLEFISIFARDRDNSESVWVKDEQGFEREFWGLHRFFRATPENARRVQRIKSTQKKLQQIQRELKKEIEELKKTEPSLNSKVEKIKEFHDQIARLKIFAEPIGQIIRDAT